MSGYREPSALDEAGAAIGRGTLSVLRALGEIVLFVLLAGWVVGWAGVVRVTYAQGYPVDVAMLLAFMIAPPIVWYIWRALGHLPVERPDLSVEVPVPTSG